MTKHIFLFGDSYMDESPIYECSWMQGLRKKFGSEYEIKNYAKSATGPQTNLPIIVNLIRDKKIITGDIIICHISGRMRVNFPGKGKELHDSINWNPNTKESYTYTPVHFHAPTSKELSEKQIQILNYYRNFKNEIDFTYLTFEKLLFGLGWAMTSYLYAISQALKIKVLVFDGDDPFHDNTFRSLNNEYFHYSKYDLFKVSTAEIFYNEIDTVVDLLKADLRHNHLSDENHEILCDYIVKFIWSGGATTFPEFKENFRYANEIYLLTEKKNPGKNGVKTYNQIFRKEFIYE